MTEIGEIIRTQRGKDKSFFDISSLESTFEALKMAISSNYELMISKKKEPSRKVSLISITDLVDTINELIQNANTAITENNRLVDNFTNERNQLVKHIWNYFAHSYSAAIEVHNKRLKKPLIIYKPKEMMLDKITKLCNRN